MNQYKGRIRYIAEFRDEQSGELGSEPGERAEQPLTNA